MLNFFRRKNKVAAPEALFVDDRNKALARYLIHNRLANLDGDGIKAQDSEHVHLVLCGFSPLMLQIGRQGCFSCHFTNFREKREDNRTRITFLIEPDEKVRDSEEVLVRLKETLGNLPDYCRLTIIDQVNGTTREKKSGLDYIDIELEVILIKEDAARFIASGELKTGSDARISIISERPLKLETASVYHQVADLETIAKDIDDDDLLVPVDAAMMVGQMYNVSNYFKTINLHGSSHPKEFMPFVKKYARKSRSKRKVREWNQVPLELKLSNLYCSDGYEYRLRSICCSPETKMCELERSVLENLEDLARTEHARWNVEKLLLGFRPYTEEEMWIDENKAGREQKEARNAMKQKKVHINICSWARLNRIMPDAIQYDSFLMLAMPTIVKKAAKMKKDERK